MKAVQYIRSRIRTLARQKDTSAEQDLVLYRQLRQAENKIYASRDLLDSIVESHRKAVAAKESAQQVQELQNKIHSLEKDIGRLETEYQCAQMNVRTYFYLQPCSDRLPEAEAAAGQPA